MNGLRLIEIGAKAALALGAALSAVFCAVFLFAFASGLKKPKSGDESRTWGLTPSPILSLAGAITTGAAFLILAGVVSISWF